MPVAVYTGAQTSIGNGITTVFAYGWKILDQTHIEVKVDGVVKVLGADYTVQGVGNSNGGSVTFLVAPAVAAVVQRARKVPYQRDEDYQANGDFKEETVDKDLDLREMQIQQLSADIARAFKAPLSVTADQLLTDAMWAARAGMLLGFDGAGGFGVFAALNQALVSAYMTTLLDDPDAPTARNTLGAVLGRWPLTLGGLGLDASGVAKGGILAGSGAGALAIQAVGAAGAVPMARPAAANGLAYVAAMNKAIYGFMYANNGANSIDFAAGGAMDSTGAYWITGAALTKDITAAWAVGNAAGMLDTGVIGNNDYYLYAIARSDTGVVDYIASLAAPAVGPLMPANYTNFRAIGWVRRLGGVIVAFHAYETEGGGLEMNWDSPFLDVALLNTLTTARRTDALSVPRNFSTIANLNASILDATQPGVLALVCCPDQTDLVVGATVSPLFNVTEQVASRYGGNQLLIRTSATGTVASRSNFATPDEFYIATAGFLWARRN